MLEAELREEIGKTILSIVECLKDFNKDVRSAAAKALSSLGEHRTCPSVSPPPSAINDVVSPVAQLNTERYIYSASLAHCSSFKPSGQCPRSPCRTVIASCYRGILLSIGTS